MIVYALVDPRNESIRYVGKTHRTAHRRLRRHLAPCHLADDTYKDRWIRQLLSAGLEPEIVVLQTCSSAETLAAAERNYIALLRAVGVDLTNGTPGGDGGSGPHSAESKEKIRRALLGKPKSAEHRMRTGLATRGRRASDATREKMRVAHRCRPREALSPSHRVSISLGKGGRPFVDQHGTRYETQNAAARTLGISLGHINDVLHGQRNHVHGYRFSFVTQASA